MTTPETSDDVPLLRLVTGPGLSLQLLTPGFGSLLYTHAEQRACAAQAAQQSVALLVLTVTMPGVRVPLLMTTPGSKVDAPHCSVATVLPRLEARSIPTCSSSPFIVPSGPNAVGPTNDSEIVHDEPLHLPPASAPSHRAPILPSAASNSAL